MNIKRALKDSFNLSKSYYFTLAIKGVFEGLSPMIAIIFSQIIINALAARKSFEVVLQSVLLSLFLGFLVLVISGLFAFFEQYLRSNYIYKLELIRNTKMIDMDYNFVENPQVIALRRKITVSGFSSQYSLENLPSQLHLLIKSFTTTVVSILLLLPIFTSKTGTYLDSNLFILAFIIYLILSFYLPFKYAQKMNAEVKAFEKDNYNLNLMINYVINTLYDIETGKEIRIYKLRNLFTEILKDSIQSGFRLYHLYFSKEKVNTILSTLVAQIGSLLLILFVTFKIIEGQLGPGHLVSSMTSLNMLLTSLPVFLLNTGSLTTNTSAIESHYEYMDLPNQNETGSLVIKDDSNQNYDFTIKDMSFGFSNSESPILKDINVHFKHGKSYAIVGENGSGKTTFIKLLTRLYSPNKGEILLNDINIKQYLAKDYYSLFNIVFQDFSLFSFKLGETVATNRHFDPSKVMESLEEVGFKNRLDSLDYGLDTILSKSYDTNGVSLSGGEKQKIAIARAIHKQGPIYVLDEPTSALDPMSEFEIYNQFHSITKEKTSIFISHRLSSCRFCDEILVFDQGSIIEQGSHETLIAHDGKYKQLWDAQAQYYQ